MTFSQAIDQTATHDLSSARLRKLKPWTHCRMTSPSCKASKSTPRSFSFVLSLSCKSSLDRLSIHWIPQARSIRATGCRRSEIA